MGWSKYLPDKNFVGMSSFGASGPYKDLYNFFGISVEKLVKKIMKNNIKK